MMLWGLPVEIVALAAGCVIGLVHVSAQSFSYKGQVGNAYTVGARDDETPATGLAGRMWRAQRNFGETFPLFAAAVIAVLLAHRTGGGSAWGCGLYLAGRACYIPAYASGAPWVRTVCWQVATIGIVVLLAVLIIG